MLLKYLSFPLVKFSHFVSRHLYSCTVRFIPEIISVMKKKNTRQYISHMEYSSLFVFPAILYKHSKEMCKMKRVSSHIPDTVMSTKLCSSNLKSIYDLMY